LPVVGGGLPVKELQQRGRLSAYGSVQDLYGEPCVPSAITIGAYTIIPFFAKKVLVTVVQWWESTINHNEGRLPSAWQSPHRSLKGDRHHTAGGPDHI